MKILDLPLKAKWYDMIESGEKKEEYREIKPYWIKRLLKTVNVEFTHYIDCDDECVNFYMNNIDLLKSDYQDGGFRIKDFTHVRFRYGYTKRTMLFELKEIVIGKGNPEWGAPNNDVFILKLGERCNINSNKVT